MSEKIEKGIEKINGWKDETAARANAFASFLQKYSNDEKLESEKTHRHYGFDFSTSGKGLSAEERAGEIKPSEVRIYYEGGEIKKIHVVYGAKSETDVYLDGQALEDFLKE